jgi:hypothetical protein
MNENLEKVLALLIGGLSLIGLFYFISDYILVDVFIGIIVIMILFFLYKHFKK